MLHSSIVNHDSIDLLILLMLASRRLDRCARDNVSYLVSRMYTGSRTFSITVADLALFPHSAVTFFGEVRGFRVRVLLPIFCGACISPATRGSLIQFAWFLGIKQCVLRHRQTMSIAPFNADNAQ